MISESLARGLKERYFFELQEGALNSIMVMLNGMKIYSGRNKFDQWAESAKIKLGPNVISTYHGGSKRRQYFAFEFLDYLPEREFNSWMEKSVYGRKIVIREGSFGNNSTVSRYGVSEHAILRIFQRLDLDVYAVGYSQRKILSELSLIPLWSNYWLSILDAVIDDDLEKYKDITIYIPSENGLFFANFDVKTYDIEVRTFVNDGLLTSDQKYIKEALNLIGHAINPSALTFASSLTVHLDPSIVFVRLMLSSLIFTNEAINSIVKHMTLKIDDDKLRFYLRNKIFNAIKEDGKYMDADDFEYLKLHSTRDFSNYCVKKFKVE